MNRVKIQLVGFLLLISGMVGFAQQDPMYTQYMNNPLLINPAFAGVKEVGNLTGVFRKQWVGLEGAPTTSSISYNTPVNDRNYSLGGSLLYDEVGPVIQTGVYIDYAYRIKFDEKKNLSLGIKGGFNSYRVNLQSLRMDDVEDIGSMTDETLFLPNFGVGAFYYTDQFYLGLSVPKLIKNVYDSNNKTTIDYLNREEWHWFLTSGYLFLLDENIDFKPSIITRYAVGAPLSIEANASFIFNDKIWLGALFRVGNAVGGIVRWQINNKLHVGYSFDYSYSELKTVNRGTHEIFIGFDFMKKEERGIRQRFF